MTKSDPTLRTLIVAAIDHGSLDPNFDLTRLEPRSRADDRLSWWAHVAAPVREHWGKLSDVSKLIAYLAALESLEAYHIAIERGERDG